MGLWNTEPAGPSTLPETLSEESEASRDLFWASPSQELLAPRCCDRGESKVSRLSHFETFRTGEEILN